MSQEETLQPTYRALLIEDDDIDYRALRFALDQGAFAIQCDRVHLLSDAQASAAAFGYDIIIADLNLPDSRGLATITSLLDVAAGSPIVVLSAMEDDVIALEAVQAGAQDYISKQYITDAPLINRTLRHAMERHQHKISIEDIRNRERFLAHYDQCTSLPNRLLFLDRIQQTVTQAQRNQNKFALFFIDLDRFKHVNDVLGHNAGDEVLRCVAERMKGQIRDSDTVARFGGDEFVLILQLSDNHDAMERLAKNIVAQINEPIFYGNHQCTVGASVGIACYPRHGHSAECLIKNADMAMYDAKRKGRNQVQFFTHELFEQQSYFFTMEKALREAIQAPEEHFSLHYQPRIELSSGAILAAEALIRWQHPTMGDIHPDQFIPLAEDLGFIEIIDQWVLESACKKSVEWQQVGKNVCISVNISGRSFNSPHFVSKVVKPILSRHQLPGHKLEMEITEGVLLSDSKQVLEQLKALKDLGIRLAIDDFGTGFSSLSYLNRFPIDILKIDGSFVCDNTSTRSEKALLKAIIAIGEALDMNIIAECVETQTQYEYLIGLGCHEGQGYYWHKPSPNWNP